ncbi:hypothetical protein [Acidaminobacter hydrogenoformans]|uniref:Uncharacterized protein n=1 Tax=Acidaminobacter hydrogenoformans DSM 2784 TaxID=1120920 RepID=A0A1G5S0M1_9FIRM|nr:hypothetical protein [Acidaminobacter hydrogenoformans]SCZ79826.1 hypothetical protein SAMN03080599_01950 [Acidaminobacter hydrogenoformans DSM 2784]
MLISNPVSKGALPLPEMVRTAIATPKCRKCGCMKETLLTLEGQLSKAVLDADRADQSEAEALLKEVKLGVELMEPIEYT